MCRSKKKVDDVTESDVDDVLHVSEHDDSVHANVVHDQVYFLGTLNDNRDEPPWRIKLEVQGSVINFKIDTGADVSVISEDEWRKMSPRPKLVQSRAGLESLGGPVQNIGQFVGTTFWKGRRTTFRIFVLKGKTDCLLSRSAALALELVKRLDSVNQDLAFGGIGVPVKCDPIKIVLKEDAEPYSINVARRVPIPLLPKVQKELDRMLADGVIEKITEPTDWCAPIVPVLFRVTCGFALI
jgi:hypothetical protein